MRSTSGRATGGGSAKKPYQSPRLVIYGDIREITETAGMLSHTPDGAAHGMDKTN